MHRRLADHVEEGLTAACESFRQVADDPTSFHQWTESVKGRLSMLRDQQVKTSHIAPLSYPLRRTRAKHLNSATDIYDLEALTQRNANNAALLSSFVTQQRDNLVAQVAEALENDGQAHLNHFYINALTHYQSLKDQLASQQENSTLILSAWQNSLLEDWRAVLLRHCSAYGSSGQHHHVVEEEFTVTPLSPQLPPPNPNFTIWSSSPDHLSPLSNRSASMSSPIDGSNNTSSPPPLIVQPPAAPAVAAPPEGKRRRLTLNLDVSRIHSDIAAFDKIMGGGGGVGGRVPNFGASDLPPSFRPDPRPTVDVGAVPAANAGSNTIGLLQVPTGKTNSRQRSPQEAEHPAPYRGFNFGLPPTSSSLTTNVGGGGPPTILPAFNPQADLSSQLTFRAPVVPTQAPSQSKVTEVAARSKPPDARATQRKKRLSLTAKAAMAQEASALPQWWD